VDIIICAKEASMKKVLRILLSALLIPVFILFPGAKAEEPKRFSNHFFNTFDTIVSLIGYAPDQETFDSAFKTVQDRFTYLHCLFDKYNAYEGINNLYTVNQQASLAPVKVAPEMMEVLVFCRDMQKKYPGTTNIALGSVLNIWHDHREAAENDPAGATVPELAELQKAAAHTDMDKVILDEENSTVFFEDPGLSLDVGAVAKGYAAESAAQLLLASPMTSFVLNAGGNVRAGDKPLDGRNAWGVGIQDPFSTAYSDAPTVETLFLRDLSVVTSGINERYFEVDGVRYHHLIDPGTLFPARYMASVTIVTQDSLLADFLSTTLFMMPYEEGRALIDSLPEVDALWVLLDGTVHMTDGLSSIAVSKGATAE
jgi:FAD:protein FMN transferase